MRLAALALTTSLLLCPAALVCQPSEVQPKIVHAVLATRAVQGSLAGEIVASKRTAAPHWIGYSVPVLPDLHLGGNQGTVFLERKGWYGGPVHAGPDTPAENRAAILLRLRDGEVGQLRVEPVTRELDAGGLPFLWLTGVSPASSIALLKDLAVAGHLQDAAVFAISAHASDAALPALTSLTAPGQALPLREQAAFWLASQRGESGLRVLTDLARNDPDVVLRKQLTFDLTLSHDAAALRELIRMAHDDRSPGVREQAQFWMAQQAGKTGGKEGGKEIGDALRRASASDPDEGVRRQAVFALSQLADGQAVPQLITLVRTSHDPEVRRQALFWIGQSHDPAALAYLTEILTSPR